MEEVTALLPTGRTIALHTLDELLRFAGMVAVSPFAPREFRTPEAVAVAIQYGLEVGLTPLAALQNISVINGRPALYGDALLAVVIASGKLEDWHEATPEEISKSAIGRCTMKRRGFPQAVTRTFTREDATRAGLWNKTGPWKEYPSRMLQMRARGFCIRDLFADVLKGLSSAEEVIDIAILPSQAVVTPAISTNSDEEGKKLLLGAIKSALFAGAPTQSKDDKATRKMLMQTHFGVDGWTPLKTLPLERLQTGYGALQPTTEAVGADDDVPADPSPLKGDGATSPAESGFGDGDLCPSEELDALSTMAQALGAACVADLRAVTHDDEGLPRPVSVRAAADVRRHLEAMRDGRSHQSA